MADQSFARVRRWQIGDFIEVEVARRRGAKGGFDVCHRPDYRVVGADRAGIDRKAAGLSDDLHEPPIHDRSARALVRGRLLAAWLTISKARRVKWRQIASGGFSRSKSCLNIPCARRSDASLKTDCRGRARSGAIRPERRGEAAWPSAEQ